jgi:hypothetical protein
LERGLAKSPAIKITWKHIPNEAVVLKHDTSPFLSDAKPLFRKSAQ